MTTYISPSLPGMIRNLWKSDLSERSVRTALNLAGDLIQELIDLRDQPAAEHQEPPNADDPTDAEVRAAAEASEYHEQWVYGEDGFPHCECGASLVESEHTLSVVPSLMAHQARAALLAAREVARHE